MLVQDKYRKVKEFKGKGIISELEVPIGLTVSTKKYDLKIDDKELKMSLLPGKSVFVISDMIGISELASVVVFFLNDVMVLELVEGYLYIPEEDGSIEKISAKNNKVSKFDGEIDKIDWKTREEVYGYCKHIVAAKFNLTSEVEIRKYINHLMFNIKMSYYPHNNKLFSFSLLDMFHGLGVGRFDYIVKEPRISNSSNLYDVEEETDSTDYKEEECIYRKRNERKKKHTLSDSNEEDDEDDDVLPEHMHEIDIFSDYSPESGID